MQGDMNSIDFHTVFPSVFTEDAIKINAIIEAKLSELIQKEVLLESPTNVYVTERKGVNLFHPFFNSIIQQHHLHSINLLSSTIRIKDLDDVYNKKSILLTDAVGNGNEVKKIGEILSESGIYLSKVCGYVAKKEGIEKLREQFPSTEFKFINEAENHKEYLEAHQELTLVYQSRIEPLDTDHPFNIDLLTLKMEKSKIISLINKACDALFGEEEFFGLEDKLESENIIGYSIECDNPTMVIEKGIFKNQEDFFQIERLQMRFRFDLAKSQLRTMAFCSINADISKLPEENNCNFASKKYCSNIKDNFKQVKAIICPHCLDINMSEIILKKFGDKIKRKARLIDKDCQVLRVRNYTPFENI